MSTVLLAPICPHTSHHIWSNLLQNRGSVLTAGWPETSKSDPNIGRQQATIDKLKANIASLISQEQKQKKKKNQSSEPPPKVIPGSWFSSGTGIMFCFPITFKHLPPAPPSLCSLIHVQLLTKRSGWRGKPRLRAGFGQGRLKFRDYAKVFLEIVYSLPTLPRNDHSLDPSDQSGFVHLLWKRSFSFSCSEVYLSIWH